MEERAVATTTEQHDIIERVMLQGDLSKLSASDRVQYYRAVCASLRLNPLTRPFDYITLNGKLTLYARRDCADQLRKRDSISVTIPSRERNDDVYIVTARAVTPDGRADESIGAVSIKSLVGEQLANAIMKAETKAKRRVTLSICGLGWTDESEIDSIPTARRIEVDAETGEIVDGKATVVEQPQSTHTERDNAPLMATKTNGVYKTERVTPTEQAQTSGNGDNGKSQSAKSSEDRALDARRRSARAAITNAAKLYNLGGDDLYHDWLKAKYNAAHLAEVKADVPALLASIKEWAAERADLQRGAGGAQ